MSHLVSQCNQELFRAEASWEEWKAYVEYIDDIIIDGFFSSIECSLKFFLDNTGMIFCLCSFTVCCACDVGGVTTKFCCQSQNQYETCQCCS